MASMDASSVGSLPTLQDILLRLNRMQIQFDILAIGKVFVGHVVHVRAGEMLQSTRNVSCFV